MKLELQALMVLSIVTFGGAALAAPTVPAMRDDGLVGVQSASLDKAYVRPNANLNGYRKIMIDPVQVEFSKDWLRNMNDGRYVYRLRDEDVQTIRDDTTAHVVSIVANAFRGGGYEIVTAPGPNGLRLSPRVTELYVNAPDIYPPGRTRSFAREAGEATVVLEARDAASGTLLAVMVDRSTTQDTLRLTRATSVNNAFWFDGLYSRWAADSVAELESLRGRPRS